MTSIKGNSFSRGVTEAAFLGQGQIEKLMGRDFEHPDLAVGEHDPAEDPANRYDLSWAVSEDDALENTKSIDVKVEWFDKGAKKVVRLASIKARGL